MKSIYNLFLFVGLCVTTTTESKTVNAYNEFCGICDTLPVNGVCDSTRLRAGAQGLIRISSDCPYSSASLISSQRIKCLSTPAGLSCALFAGVEQQFRHSFDVTNDCYESLPCVVTSNCDIARAIREFGRNGLAIVFESQVTINETAGCDPAQVSCNSTLADNTDWGSFFAFEYDTPGFVNASNRGAVCVEGSRYNSVFDLYCNEKRNKFQLNALDYSLFTCLGVRSECDLFWYCFHDKSSYSSFTFNVRNTLTWPSFSSVAEYTAFDWFNVECCSSLSISFGIFFPSDCESLRKAKSLLAIGVCLVKFAGGVSLCVEKKGKVSVPVRKCVTGLALCEVSGVIKLEKKSACGLAACLSWTGSVCPFLAEEVGAVCARNEEKELQDLRGSVWLCGLLLWCGANEGKCKDKKLKRFY